MFLKKALNQLLLYYTHNHKIQLKNTNSLNNIKYSLLYYYLTVKLKRIKQYITKNLNKRFINISQALFTFLILFMKKKDSSLRFCINYQKLNNLTYKNQYLLLLINKTLAYITKAKIFTKLDIQQTFYRICISSEFKKLITF
jgi:hypothetical protein